MRGAVPRLVVLATVLELVAIAARGDASRFLDFVSYDGITYIRWDEERGRALTAPDLGAEFATVECSVGEDLRGCPYGIDASAAFMPTGTRMYAVRGYRTEFRLAGVWSGRIYLYQAWRNPRARVGADLYDIAGKVRAIDVEPGEPTPGRRRAARAITASRDVTALVDMIVHGAIERPRAHPLGERRYWVTLWLADGTTLERPYFPEAAELTGGVIVAPEFRTIVERYLGAT